VSIETTRPFLRELEERRTMVERFLVAARELPEMPLDERIVVIEDVTAFLAHTMIPHSKAAEKLLYPEVDSRFARDGMGASAAFDCAEIRGRIAELVDADPRDSGRLQELLYALYIVCSTHVQKEEEVYLRVLERSPERMEGVMTGISELENAAR
jgi:hypothetical protein